MSEGLSIIESGTFYRCSDLRDIVIPNTVTSIKDSAFALCTDLTEIAVPDNVTSIGDRAFFKCLDLTDISLGNNLTTIGESAFADCSSLKRITIPDSVTSIDFLAFDYCTNLTKVSVGNGLTSIPSRAFYKCSYLTDISIGTGVTSIVSGNFRDCPTLSNILMDGPPPAGEGNFNFFELPPNASLRVWPEHAEAYGGVGASWNGLPVKLRDTTPKIASLSVNETTNITLAGGPNATYRCLYSPNLQSTFTQITTAPEVIATNSSGTTSFTVESTDTKGFFILEEVLP